MPIPDGDLAFIEHCQKIIAYQQLGMELHNDAMAAATPGPLGSELSQAPVSVVDEDAVRDRLLPAVDQKLAVLKGARAIHDSVAIPAGTTAAGIHETFSELLDVMERRGEVQKAAYTEILTDRDSIPDSTAEDAAEFETLNRALLQLQQLLDVAGFSFDEFVALNQGVFNAVRAEVGLGPLSLPTFAARYLEGINGQRVRFFTQD